MAISPVTLPISAFPKAAQPAIGHLNRWMRDISGLQGTLQNSITSSRSDATIVRQAAPQVALDRVTPTPTSGGTSSGGAATIGTPALTFGLVNTAGSTTTVVSINSSIAIFGTQAARGVSTGSAAGTSAFAARADHVHAIARTLIMPTTTTGDMIYFNGTSDARLPAGLSSEIQGLQFGTSNAPVWATITYEKSIVIETPTNTEDLTLWHTPENIQVTEVRGVLQGGSVTTVTVDVKWAADRSTAGTSLLDIPAAVTSTTTGDVLTLGTTTSNVQPTTASYLWLETSSGGGTGTLHLSFKYKRLP